MVVEMIAERSEWILKYVEEEATVFSGWEVVMKEKRKRIYPAFCPRSLDGK